MKYRINPICNMSKTQKMIFIALLVAQAIVLNVIERMIPLNFTIPGAKLGLANIITLTCIYLFSFKETLAIIILRTVLGSLLAGSLSSFLYSISGALLSFIVMYFLILISKEKISTIGISVFGGVFHNIGQLTVAMIIIENANIFYYLPILMITGVATGVAVGICTKYLLVYLRRLKYFN
ncbi:Gx transporter family protein [Haloimpatiens sp. FM7330]|uniref:Gx transporter family protein n=1 Tax=Haloimpatiens sp. FM7330 TaxID=3298610 RepID=UPI0036331679